MVERKGGHDDDSENGATTTYLFLVTQLRCRCKRKSDGSVSCKDGGVLLITGFPHVGGKAKEGQHSDSSDSRQNKGASHTRYIHSFTGVVSGLYLRSVQTGRFSFSAKERK